MSLFIFLYMYIIILYYKISMSIFVFYKISTSILHFYKFFCHFLQFLTRLTSDSKLLMWPYHTSFFTHVEPYINE